MTITSNPTQEWEYPSIFNTNLDTWKLVYEHSNIVNFESELIKTATHSEILETICSQRYDDALNYAGSPPSVTSDDSAIFTERFLEYCFDQPVTLIRASISCDKNGNPNWLYAWVENHD